ncbi:MAG: hypothetical protein QXQ48_02380 [Nitrososphaerota archaeon]
MSGLVPPWWRVYCEAGPDWVIDDFGEVLSELEKRPPNRQLLSPVVGSFLAGLLQASGGLGYLKISESPEIYTPFVMFRCDEDAGEFIVRQVGDAWVLKSRPRMVLYVLGLRAVILLKIIGPYLRGAKHAAYEVLVKYGYKLEGNRPWETARLHGMSIRSSIAILEGKSMKQIMFEGFRRLKKESIGQRIS